MRQTNSNPLLRALGAGQRTETHPESEMLSAFSEGALLPREQGKILEHLAYCERCRRVIHLSCEAADTTSAEVARRISALTHRWFVWAMAAAALVLVGAFLMFYGGGHVTGSPAENARLADQPRLAAQPEPPSAASLPKTGAATPGRAFVANAPESPEVSTRAHWRINHDGRVERSYAGRAWETVDLPGHGKVRVIAVSGNHVWAGGEQIELFHSSDGGSRWQRVPLAPKSGTAHALIHIRFRDEQNGTIEAEDGTLWETSDGGRSWR